MFICLRSFQKRRKRKMRNLYVCETATEKMIYQCSWCKKWRNRLGDFLYYCDLDFLSQIIIDSSIAIISHTICEKCYELQLEDLPKNVKKQRYIK